MADPFIGEIRAVGFNFAPVGWALCDGQLLSISQYSAVFALLGTFYGGNGTSNFALPDLRGRVAVDFGNTIVIGEESGVESVTLITSEIPPHTHTVDVADVDATSNSPGGLFSKPNVNAKFAQAYTTSPPNTTTDHLLEVNLGDQPHTNLQPYTAINYIIALQGVFPSRN